jgi:hypothetical protein
LQVFVSRGPGHSSETNPPVVAEDVEAQSTGHA